MERDKRKIRSYKIIFSVIICLVLFLAVIIAMLCTGALKESVNKYIKENAKTTSAVRVTENIKMTSATEVTIKGVVPTYTPITEVVFPESDYSEEIITTTAETSSVNDSYTLPVHEDKTPLASHGKLSVDKTDLVDCNGNIFQLKGVSTHGITWFPEYVNKEAFRTLRDDWGANAVRLALYTAEYNGYCSGGNQTELKALVENGVEYATELGMYVIIDWHILSDGNPNTNKTEAISFFTEMAQKYKDYSNVIYEICNEPNGGVDWNTVKTYADEVIAAIRQYDSDAIILVGTPTWSQEIDKVASNPVNNPYNVMYVLHFYAATHKEELRERLKSAVAAGTPVFISEFSICDASGNGGIDYDSANAWKELINSYNISYMGWNLSNKAETSSLIKSSCSKTCGWNNDDLTDTGKWLKNFIAGY